MFEKLLGPTGRYEGKGEIGDKTGGVPNEGGRGDVEIRNP
jgi:hypothetical protein